jgi:hypothetical protein
MVFLMAQVALQFCIFHDLPAYSCIFKLANQGEKSDSWFAIEMWT